METFGSNQKGAREMTREDISRVRQDLAGLSAAVALRPDMYPMGETRRKAAERNLERSGIGGSQRAEQMLRRVA